MNKVKNIFFRELKNNIIITNVIKILLKIFIVVLVALGAGFGDPAPQEFLFRQYNNHKYC